MKTLKAGDLVWGSFSSGPVAGVFRSSNGCAHGEYMQDLRSVQHNVYIVR